MKVIIAGATGLVGSSLLHDCIANENITEIFALTRKPLAKEFSDAKKATVIIHDDFLNYSPELMGQMLGAEACLWALGGRSTQFPDMETFRKVSVDFLLAAAAAMSTYLAPALPDGNKFRFIFTSGKDAEWNPKKSLLFMGDTRHVKGECEKGLAALEDANKEHFQSWFIRPSVILPRSSGCMSKTTGKLYGAVSADKITKVMVKIALNGYPERIVNMNMLESVK